jgi:uncharacterized protein (TIGR02466 family)
MNSCLHTLFPKTLVVIDDLLTDKLDVFETRTRELVNQDSYRNGVLNVDSTHTTNQSLHHDPVFEPLVTAIYDHATEYLKELGYFQVLEFIKIDAMWTNISVAGDFLYPHVHGNSIISGAFYIKTNYDSKIKFFNDIADMMPHPIIPNDLSATQYDFECIPGRMILFKSNLMHSTPKQTGGEKIVISFNIGTSLI